MTHLQQLADAASATAFTLEARDGFQLAACYYPTHTALQGNILLAGATGVQQKLYRRFAGFANEHGFNVLTLDYRGIGGSRPKSLKGFEANYLDWARLDLSAAVDLLADSGAPLYWVGHSYGGQALGLIDNHNRIDAAYCFGTGAGWAGWMPPLEAMKVRLMWNVILPLIVARKGYMAWSLLGMGDDLPLGIYRDWKRWCANPHYFFDDPAMSEMHDIYARVQTPSLFANAVDDAWAPPKSRDAFVPFYRNANVATLDLTPSRGSIGHMGYFLANAEVMWADCLTWLQAQAQARPATHPIAETAS